MARHIDRKSWYVAIVVALVLSLGLWVWIRMSPVREPLHPTLSTHDTEQLGFFRDRVNLFLTIATLFLGGAGTFLINARKERQQRWALVALAGAGLSLLAGFFAYDVASWMLDNQIFNLSMTEVSVPSITQAVLVLVSLVALVISFFLWEPEAPEGRCLYPPPSGTETAPGAHGSSEASKEPEAKEGTGTA